MASINPDRSDHFPRIQRYGLVENKAKSRPYFEDSGVDVRDLWRDHGNERQPFRKSPPTIGGFRRGSQNSSGANSPVQRRSEVRTRQVARSWSNGRARFRTKITVEHAVFHACQNS